MRIGFHAISLFLAVALMTTTAPATPEARAAGSAQYAVATANPYATDAGMRVLGLSIVTDMCLPDALEPATVERIIAVATRAEPKLTALVRGVLEAL